MDSDRSQGIAELCQTHLLGCAPTTCPEDSSLPCPEHPTLDLTCSLPLQPTRVCSALPAQLIYELGMVMLLPRPGHLCHHLSSQRDVDSRVREGCTGGRAAGVTQGLAAPDVPQLTF